MFESHPHTGGTEYMALNDLSNRRGLNQITQGPQYGPLLHTLIHASKRGLTTLNTNVLLTQSKVGPEPSQSIPFNTKISRKPCEHS